MKKIIFLIIIIIITNHKYADARADFGYLGYSYSKEKIDGENIQNHSIGQEILFFSEFFRTTWFWGVNYRFGDNGKGLATHFLIIPGYVGYCLGDIFCPAIGTDVSYNLDKKIWGIGPQVDFVNLILFVVKINVTYRYNIYFKGENSHEIGFTVSIIDYFGGLNNLW